MLKCLSVLFGRLILCVSGETEERDAYSTYVVRGDSTEDRKGVLRSSLLLTLNSEVGEVHEIGPSRSVEWKQEKCDQRRGRQVFLRKSQEQT